jgi:hypothetical protein
MQNLHHCQSRKETSTKEKTKGEGGRRKGGFHIGRLKHKQNPCCLEFLAPSIKLYLSEN